MKGKRIGFQPVERACGFAGQPRCHVNVNVEREVGLQAVRGIAVERAQFLKRLTMAVALIGQRAVAVAVAENNGAFGQRGRITSCTIWARAAT